METELKFIEKSGVENDLEITNINYQYEAANDCNCICRPNCGQCQCQCNRR